MTKPRKPYRPPSNYWRRKKNPERDYLYLGFFIFFIIAVIIAYIDDAFRYLMSLFT